jgi:hypothetical protein
MDFSPDTNLTRFAGYFGFRYDLLAGADPYAIEHADGDFSGRVEAIRITENGRFGNIFYQILHAVMLARQMGAGTIVAFPFPGCPEAAEIRVEELRIVFRPEACPITPPIMPKVPTLVGHFFNSFPFESALRAQPPAFVWDTIQRYMKPLFQDALGDISPVSSSTLVMSFRAGDIFSGDIVSPWYVQPPTSYFMRAVAFARAELGVRDVRLVFEDRGNPTIAAVEARLAAQGIPYAVQSASFLEDLRCLAGASHLVAPYSTFCEVAAMLSDRIETYFGFRSFESHQHIHARREPLLLGVLRQKGVRAVLIDDAAGAYIPPRTWDRSALQLSLMRDYPEENLRVLEGGEADLIEAAEGAPDWRDRKLENHYEALHVRQRLIGVRHEMDALECRLTASRGDVTSLRERLTSSESERARLATLLRETQRDADRARERADQAQLRFEHMDRIMHQSMSWRVTAPLRWVMRTLRRILGRAEEPAREERP